MGSTGVATIHALSCAPARARRELRSLLRAYSWPGDVETIVLAVHEAVMNASQHGGGCAGVVARFAGDDLLAVEVHDRGPGFDVEHYLARPPSTTAERGRGVWLIGQIATGWEMESGDGGTCFRLGFRP